MTSAAGELGELMIVEACLLLPAAVVLLTIEWWIEQVKRIAGPPLLLLTRRVRRQARKLRPRLVLRYRILVLWTSAR